MVTSNKKQEKQEKKEPKRFEIFLVNSAGRNDAYYLDNLQDYSANSILDAIEFQLHNENAMRSYGKYMYISFQWTDENGKKYFIKLTNPARTRDIARPTTDIQSSDSYKFWSKYWDGRTPPPKPEPQDGATEKQRINPITPSGQSDPSLPYLADPNWYQNDPSKVAGKYHAATPDLTSVNWKAPSHDTFYDQQSDWQKRWDAAMQWSRDIKARDDARAVERGRQYAQTFTEYANAITEGSKNLFNWPQAIYRILVNAIRSLFTMLSYIPEDIFAAVQRMQLNLTIVHLALERLFNIGSQLLDYSAKSFQLLSMIDWESATKIINAMAKSQIELLEKGKEAGVFDTNYSIQGPEKWRIPNAKPNTPEEMSTYLALSALAKSPIFGPSISSNMNFEMLLDYQNNTGVGIPNKIAWYKFILNDQIGTTVPIQEATDMAGQIPDWFLGKTKDISKQIAPLVHKNEHKEIKALKS